MSSTGIKKNARNGHVSLPHFYVISVNFHSSDYIKQLLASLKQLEFIDNFIIVNHSPEDRLDGLEAPFPIRIIHQKNRGYGAGLNRGLREITEANSIALLCNPDVALINPEAMAEALAYLAAHPAVGCLIPWSVDQDGKSMHPCRTFYSLKTLLASRIPVFRQTLPPFYRQHLYMDSPRGEPIEVDWGCGGAMLYRVSALKSQAAFDEGFFLYFEDVDLCARLWRQGSPVVFYPRLIFRHELQKKSHTDWRFLRYHLASLIRFVWKYRGLPQRACLLKT